MLRRLATGAESIAAALLIAAVLLNFANVIARYAFGRPIVTAEEILQFANVWIVMLAGAAVARLGIHLRMDMVSHALPESLRFQAEVSAGTTAEAENHTAIARSSANARRSSVVRFVTCLPRQVSFMLRPIRPRSVSTLRTRTCTTSPTPTT